MGLATALSWTFLIMSLKILTTHGSKSVSRTYLIIIWMSLSKRSFEDAMQWNKNGSEWKEIISFLDVHGDVPSEIDKFPGFKELTKTFSTASMNRAGSEIKTFVSRSTISPLRTAGSTFNLFPRRSSWSFKNVAVVVEHFKKRKSLATFVRCRKSWIGRSHSAVSHTFNEGLSATIKSCFSSVTSFGKNWPLWHNFKSL